jgi:hypothetical protein
VKNQKGTKTENWMPLPSILTFIIGTASAVSMLNVRLLQNEIKIFMQTIEQKR